MRPYISGPAAEAAAAAATAAAAAAEPRSEDAVRALGVAEIKKQLRAKRIPCENVVEKDELVRLLVNAPAGSAASAAAAPSSTRYNLLSNIVHEGRPSAASKELRGSYKCHTYHRATRTWYLTEDLHVHTSETMEQLVALSEAYIQIYEMTNE
jgi:hypothetical protein